MPFDLKKGGRFNLAKSINKVSIAAGWAIAQQAGANFDVDLWVFGLISTPSGPKATDGHSHTVGYFNSGLKKLPNKAFQTLDGSITHTGDNRIGKKEGVAEQIDIDLSLLPPEIDNIIVMLSIYEAQVRKQNFGLIKSTFVRVVNIEDGLDLCQYNLTDQFPNQTLVHIGTLTKNQGVWAFVAEGKGAGDLNSDINTVLDPY